MIGALLTFLTVSALVIVTPGQDTALTIRNTLAGGRRSGMATATGVSAGQAVWAVATAAGLAAVLRASGPVFLAIRLAGAAYLVLLGAQALRDAIRSRGTGGHPGADRATTRGPVPCAAFRQGLLSNLGNPKMAVFFTTLLPQFASAFASLLAFGVLFCGLTLVWLCAYAAVVSRPRRGMARHVNYSAVEGLTGAVLVGLGVRVASEAR
jgi:threonine/homoserine/homoserine lactone efflux protein